jgi:hypothetical protein
MQIHASDYSISSVLRDCIAWAFALQVSLRKRSPDAVGDVSCLEFYRGVFLAAGWRGHSGTLWTHQKVYVNAALAIAAIFAAAHLMS